MQNLVLQLKKIMDKGRKPNSQQNPTGTPHRMDIDLMSILHRYIEKKISTKFYVISTYYFRYKFDGQKIDIALTFFYLFTYLFINLFFDELYSMLYIRRTINKIFWRTFLNIISTGKKSKPFRCTFFDLISMDKKSTLFRFIVWCNFNGKLMQLWHVYFDVFLKDGLFW